MLLSPPPTTSGGGGQRRPPPQQSPTQRTGHPPPPAARGGPAASVPTLPNDVLARCLAYLPSPLDLAAAGAACRAWRAGARGNELWRPFVLRLWPALARFLPPAPGSTSSTAAQHQQQRQQQPNQSSRGRAAAAPNKPTPAPIPLPTLRGPLCRLFALRLPVAGDDEHDDEEEDHGGNVSLASSSSSSDEGSDSDGDQRRPPAAPPAAGAPAAGAAAVRGRQLQVPLRPEDVILHIEIRDLEQEFQVDWMRALRVARPLYSAAFALADPRAFWLAMYSPVYYQPRTLPGVVVDAPRLAALLSDNLDEVGSPLLRLDVAALHAPTGAVLHLAWRGGRTLNLVHSFPIEEDAGPTHPNHHNNHDEDDDPVRLILDGGTRGPHSGGQQQRLDLSFCPAINLPTGPDPSRPSRPAVLRSAPVELRIYDRRAEEFLDEAGTMDRRQATVAFLRFLAGVGSGPGPGAGWRA